VNKEEADVNKAMITTISKTDFRKIILTSLCVLFLDLNLASAYTANKVWFEFRPEGTFRVRVVYTVPELKEFREAFVEFTSKKKAEAYYWALLRGADFYHPNPEGIEFVTQPIEPQPW